MKIKLKNEMSKFPDNFALIEKNRARIGITHAANFASRVRIYPNTTRTRGTEIYDSKWKWNRPVAAEIEKLLD